MRPPVSFASLVVLLGALVGAGGGTDLASAASRTRSVHVAAAVPRDCAAALLPAAAGGVVQRPYSAGVDGVLGARLDGGPGDDWDLAVFAASGEKLAGSATFTADELVTVPLGAGRAVVVQACRRSGPSASLPLALRFDPMPLVARPATPFAPQLLRVRTGGRAGVERLTRLGLDVTENVDAANADVLVVTAADRDALRATRLPATPVAADLVAADAARARRDVATPSRARAAPSGRTTYRSYEDYGRELRALADGHPRLVRRASLPGRSLEGRPLDGVEIATDAGRAVDGRPIFLLTGLTHAREWPSGELALEYARDVVARFAAGEPRITRLLARVRLFVFPILNPDGFVVSRQAGAAAGDDTDAAGTLPRAVLDQGAYKRKNCRTADPSLQATPCLLHAPDGVDLNRGFGAYWGGPGSSADPASQRHRGPAPFSEPEAQALRAFAAAHQVQVFVSNHTYSPTGLWLRQPGFALAEEDVGPATQDEAAMAALGGRLAAATGYRSAPAYAIGNATGAADDWLYYSQGTYAYTAELRGANFHTDYARAVSAEFKGDAGHPRQGLREAYTRAAEAAADPAQHVVLRGSAPPGRTLRLTRTTTLHTTAAADEDGTRRARVAVPETTALTLRVPASGRFVWHLNPSTRPVAPRRSERFTLTCAQRGIVRQTARPILADRGDVVTRHLTCGGAVLAVARPSFSARRARRAGRVRVRLRSSPGVRAQRVAVRLLDARGRTLFSRRLARLARAMTVTLRPRPGAARRLRPGRAVIEVRATAGGRTVRVRQAVRVLR